MKKVRDVSLTLTLGIRVFCLDLHIHRLSSNLAIGKRESRKNSLLKLGSPKEVQERRLSTSEIFIPHRRYAEATCGDGGVQSPRSVSISVADRPLFPLTPLARGSCLAQKYQSRYFPPAKSAGLTSD